VKPVSFAIVGAGIGGLATAALLLRAGHRVQVYEQATRFARVGAGIQMAPNAVKVLRHLGLEETLRSTAFQADFAISRTWDTGLETSRLPLGEEVERAFGAPYLFLHRADLHAAIAGIVPSEVVHLGMKLAAIDQGPQGVDLRFTDGTSVRADAVIGADGVHSLVRETLLGPEKPRFTGRVAYRTTYAADRLRGIALDPVRTKWWGPDRHMVVYYVTRARDELYFVTSVPERAEWTTPESWSAKGDLDELRAAYAGFHPEVQAILAACPEVSKSSALEDAAVLSRCLHRVEPDGVQEAYRLYERIRKPRASDIQAGSSANNWLRDKADPGWVYGHDASTVELRDAGA